MGRVVRRTALLVLFGIAAVLGPRAACADECAIPEDLLKVETRFTRLDERLKAGGPVRIVAIGGASTTGAAAGSVDLAYPHRLQEVLAGWFPKVTITVVNKAVPRQSAAQMLARFPDDVFAEDPALVIWETGVNDAVRGVGLEDFTDALQAGVDQLKAHGIDIILMDMQFSRSAATVIDFERYLDALHRLGDVNEVYVFPRYEMMRYWSEQNVFRFDEVSKSERAALAARVYQCIGRHLAEAIRLALN
jgi:hypothetical protein